MRDHLLCKHWPCPPPWRRRLRGCSGASDRTKSHRRREPLETAAKSLTMAAASLRHICTLATALRKSSALTSDACRGEAAWRNVCTS